MTGPTPSNPTESMQYTRYGFDICAGAFFQMSTANARDLLPKHLEPIEAQHTRSVLAVLAFRFTESEVGAYDELVMAVITPPLVHPGQALPKAAFFPFMVATSTAESRAHAMERWHLPHHPENMDFSFDEQDDRVTLSVSDSHGPALNLTVTGREFRSVVNPYHVFTCDLQTGQPYKVNIFMDAPHSEHEAERGELIIHDHPATAGLVAEEIDTTPFREEWYRAGIQTFEELEKI